MSNLLYRILRIGCGKNVNTKPIICKLYSKDAKQKPKYRILSFLLVRYSRLVKYFEETFPTATKYYKAFNTGMRHFTDDTLLLCKVYKKITSDGISSLTRRELEVYHEMPKDIIRVAPLIIIGAAVPFGAALFAFACKYPRLALSHHFWSESQKNEFSLLYHKDRLKSYNLVFTCMQERIKLVKAIPQKDDFDSLMEGLRRGMNPTAEEVLKCKPIFEEHPFSLKSLGKAHTNALLKLHQLNHVWQKKARLDRCGRLIHAMDNAILKEGGVKVLTPDELKWACFFRGLNPIEMKHEDIILWLEKWLHISKEINEKSFSLLLHCPLLLAYNERTNVALLKG